MVSAGKDGALTGGDAFMRALGDDLIDSVVGENIPILTSERPRPRLGPGLALRLALRGAAGMRVACACCHARPLAGCRRAAWACPPIRGLTPTAPPPSLNPPARLYRQPRRSTTRR